MTFQMTWVPQNCVSHLPQTMLIPHSLYCFVQLVSAREIDFRNSTILMYLDKESQLNEYELRECVTCLKFYPGYGKSFAF